MGQTPGGGSQLGLNLLKGGLTGLSQGLQSPRQGFDFSKLQQGFQAQRRPLGQGVTPNAAQNSFSANPMWGGDPNVNGGYYT